MKKKHPYLCIAHYYSGRRSPQQDADPCLLVDNWQTAKTVKWDEVASKYGGVRL